MAVTRIRPAAARPRWRWARPGQGERPCQAVDRVQRESHRVVAFSLAAPLNASMRQVHVESPRVVTQAIYARACQATSAALKRAGVAWQLIRYLFDASHPPPEFVQSRSVPLRQLVERVLLARTRARELEPAVGVAR